MLAAMLAISCGTDSSNPNSTGNGDTASSASANAGTAETTVDEGAQFKYDMVIGSIPIPFDIMTGLKSADLHYMKDAMNTTSNSAKYSNNTSKAVNLGIYGGDLAYCITYEQYSEVGNYLKSAKKLADDLSIPIAFDQKALSMFQKYKDNKDSLEKLVFRSYIQVDKTLKSNERLGLASLVVTGGWIEGLYTTTKNLNNAPKSEKTKLLYQKIWEQKFHTKQLLGLMNEFKSTDADFEMIVSGIESISNVYKNLEKKGQVNEKEVAEITQKISELRNKITAN